MSRCFKIWLAWNHYYLGSYILQKTLMWTWTCKQMGEEISLYIQMSQMTFFCIMSFWYCCPCWLCLWSSDTIFCLNSLFMGTNCKLCLFPSTRWRLLNSLLRKFVHKQAYTDDTAFYGHSADTIYCSNPEHSTLKCWHLMPWDGTISTWEHFSAPIQRRKQQPKVHVTSIVAHVNAASFWKTIHIAMTIVRCVNKSCIAYNL